MENNFYVYEWFKVDTLEIFYVGKGHGMRRYSMKDRNIYFKRIVNKYNCTVRIYRSGLTEEQSFELEKDRIHELKLIGQAKCNLTYGGEGGVPTEETRRKLSESSAWKGKGLREETKKKLSLLRKGKKLSLEHIKSISKGRKGIHSGENHWLFGKHHSEETREKISKSNSGENNAWFGKNLPEEMKSKISQSTKEYWERLSEDEKNLFSNKVSQRTKEGMKKNWDKVKQSHKKIEKKGNGMWKGYILVVDIVKDETNKFETQSQVCKFLGCSQGLVSKRLKDGKVHGDRYKIIYEKEVSA